MGLDPERVHRHLLGEQLVEDIQRRGALVRRLAVGVVGLEAELVEHQQRVRVGLVGGVERLLDVRGTDGLVPGHVPADPRVVDGLVDRAPRRHLPPVPADRAVDGPEQQMARAVVPEPEQLALAPSVAEALVPGQVGSEHEHAVVPGERDDPVPVREVEAGRRFGAEPVPEQVVFREQDGRLLLEETAVLGVGDLPRGRRRSVDQPPFDRRAPQGHVGRISRRRRGASARLEGRERQGRHRVRGAGRSTDSGHGLRAAGQPDGGGSGSTGQERASGQDGVVTHGSL